MKKLLGFALALALALPASAAVLSNTELIGEVQVIGSQTNHKNLVNKDPANGTNVRVLAGLSFDVVEDVRANLLFQYVNDWGTDNTGGFGTTGRNLDAYWADVRLVEANLVLSNLLDCFEAKIGRQFYGEEDSAVMYFGPNHYNYNRAFLQPTSLDAAVISYSDDYKAFTVMGGKIAAPFSSITDEAAIYGADLRLNISDTFKAQIYGYDVRNINDTPTATDDGILKHAGFYGAKLAFTPETLKISAEYARNFGGKELFREPKDAGYMFKADIAFGIEGDSMMLTPRGTFLYSADDFFAFGNYQPGLIIGQNMGGQIFNRYNINNIDGLRMFNAGLDFQVGNWEKWTFAIDGYSFQDRYGRYAATLEGDFTVKYAHNEFVELFAGIGYVKNGTLERNAYRTLPNDPQHYTSKDETKTQLGMLVRF